MTNPAIITFTIVAVMNSPILRTEVVAETHEPAVAIHRSEGGEPARQSQRGDERGVGRDVEDRPNRQREVGREPDRGEQRPGVVDVVAAGPGHRDVEQPVHDRQRKAGRGRDEHGVDQVHAGQGVGEDQETDVTA